MHARLRGMRDQEPGAALVGAETSLASGVQRSPQPFRAGGWLILPEAERVLALFGDEDEEVSLTGEVARAPYGDEKALSTLAQIGHFEPKMARLHQALRDHDAAPLDVGSLLAPGGIGLLFLELTGQCNEACVHCYAESSPERREHLSEDEVLSVVRQAAALGVETIQLTGGDPLVSRTYLAAARLARELGIPDIEIYTNGLGLTERVADDLAPLGVDFAFSFYSHRPEVHDAITRTPGSQVRTLAAIERARARGLRVRVSVVARGDNEADHEATVALIEARGVSRRSIRFDQERSVGRGAFQNLVVPYGLVGGAPPDHDAALPASAAAAASPTDFTPALPAASAERAPGAAARPSASASHAPTGAAARPSAVSAEPSAHGARGKSGKLCVSYSGDVYPCIFARTRPLGSIRSSSLAQILARPLAAKERRGRALPVAGSEGSEDRLSCSDCQRGERVLSLCTLG